MSRTTKYILIIIFFALAVKGTHYAFQGGFLNSEAARLASEKSAQLSVQAQMDLPIGEGTDVEWESEPVPRAKAREKAVDKDVTDGGRYTKVGWKDLASLDPGSGKISNKKFLEALKSHLMVPGFIVPLVDGGDQLSEFILVPEPMMCIHVPAPPAQYIVTVKMKNPMAYPDDFSPWSPYWIRGRLRVEKVTSELAESAYAMVADSIEPFEDQIE